MLRHLLTSLSPSPRLASTMKEDGWGARVGLEEKGEKRCGQDNMRGPGFLAPSSRMGQSHRHPEYPNTSPPTGKNLDLSMTPHGVKALGQGKEVCTRALRGWGGG